MQGKKNLERVVVLGLVLASMGFGTANATITGGTYDVGGNYTGTFINATSAVTANATTDLNLQSGASIATNATNVNVTVNMNNHNLTSISTISTGGTSSAINVLNAYDISYTYPSSLLLNSAIQANIKLQANHDINISGSYVEDALTKNYGTGSTTTYQAGHNFSIKTPSNTFYFRNSNQTINVIAGQDIEIISSGYAANVGATGSNNVLNITAQNGKIDILSTSADEASGKGNSVSIAADTGSKVTIHAAKDINIGGKTLRAVRSQGGEMDITSDTGSIYINAASKTNSAYAGVNAGVYAKKQNNIVGTINLHSDTIVDAVLTGVQVDNGIVTFDKALTLTAPTAIDAMNGGTVTAMNAGSAKKITGDIKSTGAGSSVDLAMGTTDSYLTGATTVSNSGATNLNFANGGVWNVTGTSSLTDLVNNSTVNMRYTGNSTNETITTANLSGNGTYVMNTDVEASYDSKNVQNSGDKIIITTSSSGNNILELRDVSLDRKLASQGYLLLVEDQSNGSATFSGKDLAHGGIFKYKPVITTANPTDYSGFNASAKNWYLTGFEKTIVVSDNTKATLGLGETRYANYFMDQDTLLKRLGELRTIKGEPEQDGIWARYRHGGMDGSGFSGGSSTVQVGYDKKTANKRYTGFAFNHTSSTYDFDGGATGEGSLDALTVYNTWLGDKNHYFDIVGKLGKMRGNSTYEDSLFPEKGSYDSWYCSISGEYGRKNIDKNGWYYEPQAQLTLGRIRGDDYTTGLGTKVNMASITSLISRAGVTFGKEYNMKNSNTHSNIYGKINWLHEFKGDANTSLRDTYGDSYDHKTENSGSWWNAGFGATINVNKNTHMYLDFEKNFGGEVTTNWIGQLGCQWTWK